MGAGRCTGVTHLTIWMANYFASVRGESVAVLEWNSHDDFQRLVSFCKGKETKNQKETIWKVDYFPNAGAKELSECIAGNYQRIIIDFGEITTKQYYECSRCDFKILVGACSEWQASAFLEFLKNRTRKEKGWCYTTVFGSEETRKLIEQRLYRPIIQIPFSGDAFKVTKAHMDFFITLLKGFPN